MQESGDNQARSRKTKAVKRIAGVLLAAAVLCQPDLLYAAPHGGGGFTGAGSAHFTAAVSTALLPACTIVWDMRMVATGIMAGTTGATAGGGVATGWDGPTTRIPRGVTRTTKTTTTTSLTLPRPGTIAPILLAITRM